MKIQLASDLHLEFLEKNWPGERLISYEPGSDVLVLAGDIADGAQAFNLLFNWPVPVIYVAGNHEFYGHSIEHMLQKMREGAALNGIHFLENESVEIGGVRFLGTSLWTDYRLTLNRTQRQLMDHAQLRLNDHRLIRAGRHEFSTQDALDRHEIARAWLESELTKPFGGKTVVVTHHGPHPLSVHPRYLGDPLNAAFVSDLTPLVQQADLWLHGHVHDSFDYQVGKCRIVANPAGYITNRGWTTDRDRFHFENAMFQKGLVLELGK